MQVSALGEQMNDLWTNNYPHFVLDPSNRNDEQIDSQSSDPQLLRLLFFWQLIYGTGAIYHPRNTNC